LHTLDVDPPSGLERLPDVARSELVALDPRDLIGSPVRTERWPRYRDAVIEAADGGLGPGVHADPLARPSHEDVKKLKGNSAWQDQSSGYLASKLLVSEWWPGGPGAQVDAAWVLGSEIGHWTKRLPFWANVLSAVGMDSNERLVELANANTPNPNISFVAADVAKLHEGLPAALPAHLVSPQVIWARHVLPFLDGRRDDARRPTGQPRLDAIYEWYQRLRPGGILVIEDWVDMHYPKHLAITQALDIVQAAIGQSERDAFTGASAIRTLYRHFPGRVRWRVLQHRSEAHHAIPLQQRLLHAARTDPRMPSDENTLQVLAAAQKEVDAANGSLDMHETLFETAQIVIKKPAGRLITPIRY
jgi:SAM-dependent methyltransferase